MDCGIVIVVVRVRVIELLGSNYNQIKSNQLFLFNVSVTKENVSRRLIHILT